MASEFEVKMMSVHGDDVQPLVAEAVSLGIPGDLIAALLAFGGKMLLQWLLSLQKKDHAAIAAGLPDVLAILKPILATLLESNKDAVVNFVDAQVKTLLDQLLVYLKS